MNGAPPSQPTAGRAALPTGFGLWWAGARPRTLPAAVVPVAVGIGAGINGAGIEAVVWWRAGLALVVSLFLQIGVNYANDYSDGVRGTDDVRVGPMRLVASGAASSAAVRNAALSSFAVAGVAGLVLAASTTWWLLAVGALSIAAAWGYTGGPKPYGYLGLGEVFVFVFFGVVATVGTTFVSVGIIPVVAWVASVGVGAVACALLVVNNLRDIPTDTEAGKRTLAVRLGDGGTRVLYVALLVGAVVAGLICAAWAPWSAVVVLSLGAAVGPVRTVTADATGRDLIPVLAATGRFQLIYGFLLTLGLVL